VLVFIQNNLLTIRKIHSNIFNRYFDVDELQLASRNVVGESYQGSRFKNSACICKSDACLALKKRFQAVNDLRGHIFATPMIHEDITTDNMKLKEFWCKRAATKLKVDQMEIRSIDNRNRAKAKEKLRRRPNQIHRVQKFISVLHFDPKIIRHIFKYTHESKKYDFPLHCNPKDLSDLGLYKKGEKLCHDDADIYSNLGKICILPSYPLCSVQVDIDQCEEEAASKDLASKTIPKRLPLYRQKRKTIGTIDTLTKQVMNL